VVSVSATSGRLGDTTRAPCVADQRSLTVPVEESSDRDLKEPSSDTGRIESSSDIWLLAECDGGSSPGSSGIGSLCRSFSLTSGESPLYTVVPLQCFGGGFGEEAVESPWALAAF
jgi:hypothetical protein